MSTNTNCTTCSSSKTYIQKNAKYTGNGCTLDWIDSDALKHKFGPDYCDGMRRDRWFPSWLIEYCPEETKPGDLGYPDPCEKNVYYQLIGGIVYRVEFDCNLKEISRDPIKKYKIQDCAIESISASKITNRCDFFKNTTLVKGLEEYKSVINGVKTVSPLYQFLDIVITDDCELKAVYDSRLARRAVLPSLNCLVDYDIATDIAKVNLSKVIDNKTIRIRTATNNCDTIYSFTYAQDNIEGDGTDTSPLIAKIKVQDNIEGDGTSANRLIAKVKVDGITVTGNGTNANPLKTKAYANPNQFSGDGQSPATQYSLKTCSITPEYLKATSFTYYSPTGVVFSQLQSRPQITNADGTTSRHFGYNFELPLTLPANPCGGRWRASIQLHSNYIHSETNSGAFTDVFELTPSAEGGSIYLPGTQVQANSLIQNVQSVAGSGFIKVRGDLNISAMVDIDSSVTKIKGDAVVTTTAAATAPQNLLLGEFVISVTLIATV